MWWLTCVLQGMYDRQRGRVLCMPRHYDLAAAFELRAARVAQGDPVLRHVRTVLQTVRQTFLGP